jgi:alkylation response protein AidB-like acyl-CoA dehydrogenase
VRTDTSKKHEGISFLLIDMKAPGVEVRPIQLINGTSPFCETFFTDVKVPKDQLFGPLNGGWTVAKRLLQFERDSIAAAWAAATSARPVRCRRSRGGEGHVGLDETGRLADPDLRRRITDHLMENRAFQLTVSGARGRARRRERALERRGDHEVRRRQDRPGAQRADGRGHGPERPGLGGRGLLGGEAQAVRSWLRAKANSIEGGTSRSTSTSCQRESSDCPIRSRIDSRIRRSGISNEISGCVMADFGG